MFPPELTRSQKIAIAATVTAVVVLTGIAIFFMIRHPVFTSAVRDISLIVLALATLALDVIVIVLMWQIIKLLTYLLDELIPIMQSLQETAGTVRGTATFMSDSVVNPAIEVASKAARVRRSLGVLFGVAGDFQSSSQPRAGADGVAESGSVGSSPATSVPTAGEEAGNDIGGNGNG